MATRTLTANKSTKPQRKARRPSKPAAAPRRKSQPVETANREWYPGLCTTCTNEVTCRFPRSVDRPVVHCDEFQGAVDVRPSVAVPQAGPDVMFAVANREWYPGLCMTCEKLPVCTFPKPEGGVFRCDEFE